MRIRRTDSGKEIHLAVENYVVIAPAIGIIDGAEHKWCAITYELDGKTIYNIVESDDIKLVYKIASSWAREVRP